MIDLLFKEEATNRQKVLPFDKETFIEAIRDLPSLWDINHPSYHMRPVKNNAWNKLSVMFGKDGMSKSLFKDIYF